MGLRERLRRLENDYVPDLCPERYCTRIVYAEVIRYPDGTEERIGEEPPPLCAECSYREGGGPGGRIRAITVVLNRPAKQ
jgi:hypothetical protein